MTGAARRARVPPARAARPVRRPRSRRSAASSPARRSRARSAKSGGSGGGEGNTGGGEGLRLRLSRSSKLYATGSRAAKSSRTTVRLHALRKVKAGKYTLAVDVGEDVTVHLTLHLC